MASSPITSWQIDGETMETVIDIILGAPISLQMETAAMKLKDAPWKKNCDQPRQCIEKQRHYFANKVLSSQSCGFPVVTYGCESWMIKKAEHRTIDAFVLWCWRRLLRVPWIARRSNQSILKEISPEYLLEGLMLKLKLQYSGDLMWSTDSFEKTLMLGKIEGDDRGWDGWMASLTQWTWAWVNSRSWWWTGKTGMLQSVGSQSETRLSNWIEANISVKATSQCGKFVSKLGVCWVPPFFLESVRRSVVSDSVTAWPVHGILQARILSFSRGSSRPRDWTQVSYIAGRFITVSVTREAPFLLKSYNFPYL